jgi:L-lactate dehydrogenase complex protein LldE
MLTRKMENLEASASPLVIACDAGCIANINGGLLRSGKPQLAVHIAEILAGF